MTFSLRALCFVLFFSLISGLGIAQSEIPEQNSVLEFEVQTHDFGEMIQKKPETFSFVFTNSSEEEHIIIDNVRTPCGCTVPNWPKRPLAPGETTSIDVTYDAQKHGRFVKTIRVFVKGEKKSIFLRITGEVEEVVEAPKPPLFPEDD